MPDVVTLVSNDGQDFKVELSVANINVTLKNLIEDTGVDVPVPLPNVKGATLRKVIEWCKLHQENPAGEKVGFLDGMERDDLFALSLAANYMDNAGLLELVCRAIANQIKGKTPEEICKHFDFPRVFTPEEEEQVRKENEWCEER